MQLASGMRRVFKLGLKTITPVRPTGSKLLYKPSDLLPLVH